MLKSNGSGRPRVSISKCLPHARLPFAKASRFSVSAKHIHLDCSSSYRSAGKRCASPKAKSKPLFRPAGALYVSRIPSPRLAAVGCILSPLRGSVPLGCFAAGRARRPSLHRSSSLSIASSHHRSCRMATCKHFYSSLGSRVPRNRKESALAARFGPVYLMIQSVHLPQNPALRRSWPSRSRLPPKRPSNAAMLSARSGAGSDPQ